MGSIVGIYSLVKQQEAAEEANNLTAASMVSAAGETARAEAEAAQEQKNAAASQAAVSKLPDLEKATNLSKKKKGVQSTFTATTGAGAGMMKGTTLTPIGGDSE